ncbi:MAG: PEP-CTERM sorting domain-containing protein [Bryobacteraceae bacterium]
MHRRTAIRLLLSAGISTLWGGPPAAKASMIITGSFETNGDVGFINSPVGFSIAFGNQGSIAQMDGFVNVPTVDFGNGVGISRQLTDGAPANLGYTFEASQPTANQLRLTYRFVNNTGSVLPAFQFLFFVDGDIGGDFANEWATMAGVSGSPVSSYQAGDPQLSSIFSNLQNGTLSNTNDRPAGSPGDTAMALGFLFGDLSIGQTAEFQILLSDDGSSTGPYSMTQHDPEFTDTLTLSAGVPEPGTQALLALGLSALVIGGWRRRPTHKG